MIADDRPTDADKMITRVAAALIRLDMQKSNGQDVEVPSRAQEPELWAMWRDFAEQAVLTYVSALESHPHTYLSTSCLHGEHAYCKANTGAQGDKIPAVCKFCKTGCVCACHATGALVDVSDWNSPEDAEYDGPACMAVPPGGPGTTYQAPDGSQWVWGDCDCSRPRGHEGDHCCQPCEAPWPREPTYAERLEAPMSAASAKALRERVEAGDLPRRKVRRPDPEEKTP